MQAYFFPLNIEKQGAIPRFQRSEEVAINPKKRKLEEMSSEKAIAQLFKSHKTKRAKRSFFNEGFSKHDNSEASTKDYTSDDENEAE